MLPEDSTREEAFVAVLAAIEQDEPLTTEQQDALSALDDARTARFRAVWERLSAPARERLIRSLRETAESRLRLEYSRINYLALDDADADVRLAGVQATLEDSSAHLLHRLLDLAMRDESGAVRLAATEELAPFALLAELDGLIEHDAHRVRETLLELCRDQSLDQSIRSAALAALGYFSQPEISEALDTAFTDPQLRLGAIRGMGRSADPRWTNHLLPVLGSEDPDMRIEAAGALGEIEDERAIGPLADLVDDPEQDVRLAAVRALGSIGGDEAREPLLYLLDAEDEEVRAAAEQALTQLDESENLDIG